MFTYVFSFLEIRNFWKHAILEEVKAKSFIKCLFSF